MKHNPQIRTCIIMNFVDFHNLLNELFDEKVEVEIEDCHNLNYVCYDDYLFKTDDHDREVAQAVAKYFGVKNVSSIHLQYSDDYDIDHLVWICYQN